MTSVIDDGLCAACETRGRVGQRCPTPVCTRRGYHFIPAAFASPASQMPDPRIGQMWDAYLIVQRLGEGGVGAVYRAIQPAIMLEAALKVLSADAASPLAERFRDEAAALARLNHPHIVRILHFGEHRGEPFLVMELVPGGRTLARAAMDGLSIDRIFSILDQLVDGLEAAHLVGLVHRDVKPANVMLQTLPSQPDFVRLVDFGLAKFIDAGQSTRIAAGTPAYMAPEQLSRRGIGPWTDWYAVGVIAFELLTGARPYQAESTMEVFRLKLQPNFTPTDEAAARSLPTATRAALARLLAHEPEARAGDAASVRRLLADARAAMITWVGGDHLCRAGQRLPASEPSDVDPLPGLASMASLVETRCAHEATPASLPVSRPVISRATRHHEADARSRADHVALRRTLYDSAPEAGGEAAAAHDSTAPVAPLRRTLLDSGPEAAQRAASSWPAAPSLARDHDKDDTLASVQSSWDDPPEPVTGSTTTRVRVGLAAAVVLATMAVWWGLPKDVTVDASQRSASLIPERATPMAGVVDAALPPPDAAPPLDASTAGSDAARIESTKSVTPPIVRPRLTVSDSNPRRSSRAVPMALDPCDALMAGERALAGERWSEARAAFESALVCAEKKASALHGLARAAEAGGEDSKASRFIDEAIALQPRVAAYHGLRGRVLLRRGELLDACSAWHTALNLDPKSPEVKRAFAEHCAL